MMDWIIICNNAPKINTICKYFVDIIIADFDLSNLDQIPALSTSEKKRGEWEEKKRE